MEAFTALQESSSHLNASEPKESPEEHSFATSGQEREPPQQEDLCRLSAKPFCEYEPAPNAASTKGLSLNVITADPDEILADVMVEAASTNVVEHDRTSPSSTGTNQILTSSALGPADISLSARDGMSRFSHEYETWLEPSADLLYAADLMLAMGFYSRAHSLYCQHWEEAWPCDLLSAAQVPVIASMSRAASTAAQLLELRNKMKLLIGCHGWSGTDRREKAILHTQLAILHLRLQQPSNAASECELALWMIEHLEPWWECEPKDWRLAENLLYQCAGQLPHGLCLSKNDKWLDWFHKWWECFECHLPGPLTEELQHDQILRKLFARCASHLLLPDLRLHLAEGLHAASDEGLDSQATTRTLSICLFRHLWDIFSPESSKFQLLGSREVMRWVYKVSDAMQIGRADLFATIALALTNLGLPLHHTREQIALEGGTASAPSTPITFELLQQMNKAAIALVSEETPPSDFMRSFLNAHATISLTGVEKQAMAAESTSSLLERCSHNNTTVRLREIPGSEMTTYETMSYDPPLNPTPGSSISSGLRSMKSLQRRITDRKADASTNDEEFQEGVSRLSTESWSLHVRFGLSGRSYST